jgi:SRSO17 transposase
MIFEVMDGLVEGWESRLRELIGRMGHLFARPEPWEVFGDLVEGLLSDLEKKNCWTLAQRAGHTHPGRMQSFLCRGAWSAQALEAEVRDYVVEHLGDPDGVLIIDDTQMIKKGDKSVGVATQHCGATNQIENCQVAVMLTYAGPAGHAFIGHRLYLPKRWTDDPQRCREAGIPAKMGFATKLDQAIELLAEALAAKVPFAWATMDGGYGQYPKVRNWMAERSLPYVVATCSALPLTQISVPPGATAITRADDLLSRITDGEWQRRSCGEGSKGQRFYDWALIGLGGNLHVSDERPADGFAHTLLIRRSIADPDEVTYFLAHARQPTPAAVLIRIAGTRWKIEENNEQGKDLIGIDQTQVRTWTAWHHTITACMFAHAFLAAQRANLPHDTATSTETGDTPTGEQDTSRGKAPAHRRPGRQAPTG